MSAPVRATLGTLLVDLLPRIDPNSPDAVAVREKRAAERERRNAASRRLYAERRAEKRS